MNKPIKTVSERGIIRYLLNNVRHRIDGPAIKYPDGHKEWWVNGVRHRDDGPAIKWTDGSNFWYVNGRHHRTNGPAVEYASGTKYWYIDGKVITVENYQEFVNTYPNLVNQFLAHQALNG